MEPLILGIAGSLRNGRWGSGSRTVIDELAALRDQQALRTYLSEQADLRLQNFVEAGREEKLPFDEMYKNLRAQSGTRGLSNSEVALSAAMWAAMQRGARLDRISLVDYFPVSGKAKNLDDLDARLLAADGILVSTPVYFGDRGSLCQSLIEVIRSRPALREGMRDKVYAGISVGAKRNGGQETALVYQLMDMARLGLLVVGNDSDTTSQYGGTVCAGDVGTAASDDYGLNTAIGTGRRLAHVARLLGQGRSAPFRGPIRVLFWVLQDSDGRARRFVDRLVRTQDGAIEATVLEVTKAQVARCIACDICPTHIAADGEYRCIITTRRDDMSELHPHHLDHDLIVPVLYCSDEGARVDTAYQHFIERTRYLRRGDYALGNTVTCPLILEELGALQNMHMRATTSLLRHHTIAAHAMVGHIHDGAILDEAAVVRRFAEVVDSARITTRGRLEASATSPQPVATKYNPVGYVLSAEKDREDEKLRLREGAVADRRERWRRMALERLESEPSKP